MPGRDGTGPNGQGPATGGARGNCVTPGNNNRTGFFGQRRGFGQGFGRGFSQGLGRALGRFKGIGNNSEIGNK